MPIQRAENLDEVTQWFTRLSQQFIADKALRHLNHNIEVEVFFRDLLSLTHKWSLRDANFDGKKSQDSFDLDDSNARVAIQVTTTQSAAKIRGTLKTFVPNHAKNYSRLLFVYPSMDKTTSSADFSAELSGFDFDPARDRLDLRDLLQAIQALKIEAQEDVMKLLRKELKPLGAALQMGVDLVFETIISVIRHISDGSPGPGPAKEFGPDAERKLQRFREHTDYLKRQYVNNVSCYRAASEARAAVGYDSPRAARCAAWLKEKSLAALEEHLGDARKAFESLVQYFCSREREAGRNFEENAIRYFLADELGICNVFPNPEPT